MLKPPSHAHAHAGVNAHANAGANASRGGLDPKDWEEVEARLRALARLERIWGRSGALGSGAGAGSTSQVNVVGLGLGGGSGGGVASGGEEKERRLFAEALRDGYVLCQCVFFSCLILGGLGWLTVFLFSFLFSCSFHRVVLCSPSLLRRLWSMSMPRRTGA